jgi:PPOX class probable F420-dependent enzyme
MSPAGLLDRPKMRIMPADEARAFLAHGTRTGKLAVVRRDGSPLVTPIWFCLDEDGAPVFTTSGDTLKGRAILRDPRCSLCVDEQSPPYSYVRVDGVAAVSEEPEELLSWAIRIAARYMGPDRAEAYGRRNAVPGELLVRIRPTKIVALTGIAD